MEFWDNIVHTALLGTDKRQLKKEDFSEDLVEAYDIISQSGDKEEQYLNIAAVAYNYRKCGVQPINKSVGKTSAEEEVKLYCSPQAHQLLNDIVSAESQSLLKLWLQQCNNINQIVFPEYIPLLFDLGIKYKQLQEEIITVTGKRGEWLLPFNEAWKFEAVAVDESLWQTGTLEQRRTFLSELRQTEPRKARELLQQVWPQENANTKAELLKQLSVGISNEDVEWLDQLMNEKSQKVKEEALKLLKQVPASNIVHHYWEILKQSIQLRKEKGLLGIGSKTVLEIKLADKIDDSIFKTGIEKVSSEKGVSENDFIIYQLIAAVPPSLFEEHYQLSAKEVIELFNKSKEFKQFIPAFGLAAGTFKNVEWLKTVIASSENQLYAEALQLFPDDEKEKYALQFFENEQTAEGVIHYLLFYYKKRWSVQLTKEIFKHTAKNHYRYNRSFYKEHILSLPIEIIAELERCTPKEDYARDQWVKTSEYILQLLTLRTQTFKAFQS
jgi:hypothetical protein